MRVHLCAVGRLRAGPERDLMDDYVMRFDRTGRALALGPFSEHEVEDKKGGGMEAEADLLSRAVPAGAMICTLDERGKVLSSPEFAEHLARWRDGGRQDLAFIIGGADGIAPALRARADYELNRYTTLYGGLEYEDQTSDNSEDEFDRYRASLGLSFRY